MKKGRYIFVGADTLSYKSGVIHKLVAYRRFLQGIGNRANEVTMIQYYYFPSYYLSEVKSATIREIRDEVIRRGELIISEFGKDSLLLIEKEISYEERLALFSVGNCLFKTSCTESHSFDVFDFIRLKRIFGVESDFTYILGDETGVSVLSGTFTAITLSVAN